MAKKVTSIMSVYTQTQPHGTDYKSEWEYLRSNYAFIKDIQNTVTFCQNFQEYSE